MNTTRISAVFTDLLASGTDVDQLSEHLRQLEITQMEMPTNDAHRQMEADKLLKLNIFVEDGNAS